MQSIKETASNIAASAKSGMEKTRATVQEKVERMTAHNPAQKEMATEKKQERINQAELQKQEVKEHNAATKQGVSAGGFTSGGDEVNKSATYSTTGARGRSTGGSQMSALPGHGTGQPIGHVVEGVEHSHPIGTKTGTQRPSAAHNSRVGGGAAGGYGTGGSYT